MITPKVSIIVPVYNVKDYLPKCIDSILKQTYTNFELLLVDDGSTDSSLQVCKYYSDIDSRIKVYHQPNLGVSSARNYGLSIACGEWITFIDSDDWVEPNYLSNFICNSDDSDIIVQGLEYYDNRNQRYIKTISVSDCLLDKQNFKKQVSENRLLHLGYPVAKAFHKSVISSGICFCRDISYHEDHIFVFDAFFKSNRIRLVNSIEYKYRYFHNSASLSTKYHSWDELTQASDMMIDRLNILQNLYLEKGSTYEQDIFGFAYSPKITAVLQCYGKFSLKQLKEIVPCIIRRDELKSYYFPRSSRDKLIKYILFYFPLFFQFIVFRIYYNYKHRL